MKKRKSKARSRVMIIPANKRDAVNTALEARGHGPDNFSIPLEGRGRLKRVTHYACSATLSPEAQAEFEAVFKAEKTEAHSEKPTRKKRLKEIADKQGLDQKPQRALAQAGGRATKAPRRR